MESHIVAGTTVLEKMVARLSPDQRVAFEAGVQCGYVIIGPDQQDLQRVWAIWCMQQQQADVRIEQGSEFSVVTMHLGPAHSVLSGDGMVAIRRAFEHYGEQVLHYQTRNWCKHPRVRPHVSHSLAKRLVEIAYLDGVDLQ